METQQATHLGLPLFNMEIGEDKEGMNFISLVKNPATERNFFKFNKENDKKKPAFAFANEEKQLLTGVVMLANTPILRKTEEGQKFFVQFPKAVVEEMCFKYMKNQFSSKVNLEHQMSKQVDGVYLVESYIFDETRGIKLPEYIGEVPVGSWIATFKVENAEVWERVKNGEFEGFSLEGNFDLNVAFSKKDFQESLKSSILDANLSSKEIYNKILSAVKNA